MKAIRGKKEMVTVPNQNIIQHFIQKKEMWARVIQAKLSVKHFSGLVQLQKYEAVLNSKGYSLSQFHSILDFGCSYGRLTRHLFKLTPNARIYGCDIERKQIDKCVKSFPGGTFIVNEPAPPIGFSDEMFDFIFSYSVFTNVPESSHIAWLKELSRTLKPGGVMLHSTHSYECLKRLRFFNPESLVKYRIPCSLDEFISKPVNYHWVIPYPQVSDWGVSVISKDYVLKNWEKYSGLTLAAYIEGAIEVSPEGCQDLVLLVK